MVDLLKTLKHAGQICLDTFILSTSTKGLSHGGTRNIFRPGAGLADRNVPGDEDFGQRQGIARAS